MYEVEPDFPSDGAAWGERNADSGLVVEFALMGMELGIFLYEWVFEVDSKKGMEEDRSTLVSTLDRYSYCGYSASGTAKVCFFSFGAAALGFGGGLCQLHCLQQRQSRCKRQCHWN